MDPLLVVLDIDETLVYSSRERLEQEPDFTVGPFFVHKRPGVDEFLAAVFASYRVVFWTSSSPGYAHPLLRRLLPESAEPVFVWCSDRCTRRFDPDDLRYYGAKKLAKVKWLGYDLRRVVVVDDTPQKHRQNYGNWIRIEAFAGDLSDRALERLVPFLAALSEEANGRAVEKRGWQFRSSVEPKEAE